MTESELNKMNREDELQMQIIQLNKEIRKLNREISHLNDAIINEKTAYITVLNRQKAATFAQRERERYLSLLLANSPSIILFLGQTGRIEFCTEYLVSKSEFDNSDDILGKTLSEVLSPYLESSSHRKLMEYRETVIKSNSPLSFEMSFCFNKDGTRDDFSGLLVPMRDEGQESNGTMLMFHDITDLKRSRNEALAASRAKSSFLSNMSHEIRTPMNAIIGMTSIGKKEETLAHKNNAFEKIENASAHLLGIINDILDISKIESGKMELSPIAFHFPKMIERVNNVVAQKMEEKSQRYFVEIGSEIPDILFGDDQRLAQVITNLLSNATKFTPENGSITLTIKLLNLTGDECNLQISVRDSGIGISFEEQQKLFSSFQQAQAGTSRKYGGSGLGLAISKRILELMGGEILVESEPGSGSCFIVRASLGVSDASGLSDLAWKEETELSKDESNADFSGKAIMIVDDVDINLEIAVALLESTNIIMDTAKSGKEAFDKFIADPERYDLIFMDMQMPEIDGLTATRMIRALDTTKANTIPIIAMTANVFKEDIEKCIGAGMNGHLGKPINLNEVIRLLLSYFSD